MTISVRLLVLALCVLPCACSADDDSVLAAYPLDGKTMEQWRLPERLHEVSGLALTGDGRLLAVADEQAVIFEIDVENRRLVKAFAMGDPVVRGDFEGIAVLDEMIFLITSDGELFQSREGADGEKVDYELMDTALGERCEIEGLATDAVHRRLLIACKQPRGGMQRMPIFVWSVDDQERLESATIELPVAEITRRIKGRRINPSGIAVDPVSGNLLLIAARQRALIELSPDGSLINAQVLPLDHRHRQPEGIEITRDGRLLIADEGGNHRARLAVYQRNPERDKQSE